MISRRAWLAALVAGAAVATPAAQVFRGGTDTVYLSVTVTDASQKLVTGLEEQDFRIFEDGVAQDITIFARDRQPISLSILIDTSTSMEPKLVNAQDAAIGFVSKLAASDVAQLIEFNSDTTIRQTFTGDQAQLEQAVRKLRAGGSTSLYDALYIALDELKRAKSTTTAPADAMRRQAIVLLSDGADTTSHVSYENVVEQSKKLDVIVYAIGLRDKEPQARRVYNEAEFVLRTLSQQTGGRAFFVDDPLQLPGIYSQIADEIANQYIVGYTSKNPKRDGAWRKVLVQVQRAGATARTREGYYAPGAKR
jgi:Ca-activated chloride channel family protein